jgi:hypothetical protein
MNFIGDLRPTDQLTPRLDSAGDEDINEFWRETPRLNRSFNTGFFSFTAGRLHP